MSDYSSDELVELAGQLERLERLQRLELLERLKWMEQLEPEQLERPEMLERLERMQKRPGFIERLKLEVLEQLEQLEREQPKWPKWVFLHRNTKPKIAKPPGSALYRITEQLVSKKRMQQVYEPLFADWHDEYFEALDQKRGKVKMLAIRVRHTWAFAKASGLDTMWATVKKIAKMPAG